jgi:hypothetical protein
VSAPIRLHDGNRLCGYPSRSIGSRSALRRCCDVRLA